MRNHPEADGGRDSVPVANLLLHFLQHVKGTERTRLWGKDWSAQVSPVTALLLSLSGCQWPLTTGKVSQCHSRAGEHPAAEESRGICCGSKEKLEAVLAEVGKPQVIAVYKANAETSFCLCQIKVPNPLKRDLHTPVSFSLPGAVSKLWLTPICL